MVELVHPRRLIADLQGRGFRQAHVARASELPQSTIMRLANGKIKRPGLEVRIAVQKGFDRLTESAPPVRRRSGRRQVSTGAKTPMPKVLDPQCLLGLLEGAGFQRAEIALAAGLARSTITRIATGGREKVAPETGAALERAAETLFGGDPEIPDYEAVRHLVYRTVRKRASAKKA
jgi:transcriptional regulator with XRE-family HTH domain